MLHSRIADENNGRQAEVHCLYVALPLLADVRMARGGGRGLERVVEDGRCQLVDI